MVLPRALSALAIEGLGSGAGQRGGAQMSGGGRCRGRSDGPRSLSWCFVALRCVGPERTNTHIHTQLMPSAGKELQHFVTDVKDLFLGKCDSVSGCQLVCTGGD